MPVGAGSIRRVANATGTENKKEVAVTVPSKETTKKITAKKTTAVKTTSKKTSGTSVAKAVTKNAEQKAISNVSYNQVCHITEELPIYLL